MTEGYCAVVWEIAFDEHMAVEAAHFGDSEDTDAAEGSGSHRKHLAVGDISTEPGIGGGLEAEEGDVAGDNVALEGAAGNVRLPIRLEGAVHDELVFHSGGGELAGGGVAAVEAHEGILLGIAELTLDLLLVDVAGDGVVDVEERYHIVGDTGADELAESTVNIHLAGNGYALGGEAAVDIAWHEAELCLEGRPALIGEADILAGALMLLHPVEESQLILGKLWQYACHFIALAKLLFHIGDDLGYAWVVLMLVIGCEQVQLGVFLDLCADIIKLFDRGIAGEKILRAWAEGNDL